MRRALRKPRRLSLPQSQITRTPPVTPLDTAVLGLVMGSLRRLGEKSIKDGRGEGMPPGDSLWSTPTSRATKSNRPDESARVPTMRSSWSNQLGQFEPPDTSSIESATTRAGSDRAGGTRDFRFAESEALAEYGSPAVSGTTVDHSHAPGVHGALSGSFLKCVLVTQRAFK